MTRVIGLTGGIATGKSTVSQYLLSCGYQIIDADLITHHVQSKGGEGLKAIAAFFGPDILLSNGELDRKKLAKIVFSDKEQLVELTRIIDPFIRDEIYSEISSSKESIVILDAPTLFENGYHFICDRIITVACDQGKQIERLMSRDNLSEEEALKRINSQWPLNIKEQLSNDVIDSNGSIMQTRSQVVKLFNNID